MRVITKKIMVFALVFAFSLSTLNLMGVGEVKAANEKIRLYFILPDGWSARSTAFHCWGGENITAEGNGVISFEDGRELPNLMHNEGIWGYIDVFPNGDTIEGWQIINGDVSYNCFNAAIQARGYTEAYCVDPIANKWYTKKTDGDPIELPTLDKIFKVVGSMNNWELSTAVTMEEVSENVYETVYNDLEAGDYEFKVVQDPDDYGWEHATGDNGGNYKVTVPENKDLKVIFTYNEAGSVITTELLDQQEEEPASDSVRLYFKLPEATEFEDFVLMFLGQGLDMSGAEGALGDSESFISGLIEADDDWGYVDYKITDAKTWMATAIVGETGDCYNVMNPEVLSGNYNVAYCRNIKENQWFTEKEAGTKIQLPEPLNNFRVGFEAMNGIERPEDLPVMTETSTPGVYSFTYTNVQPGEYLYYFIQDYENYGMSLTYGFDLMQEELGYKVNVTELSNVTFYLSYKDSVYVEMDPVVTSVSTEPSEPEEPAETEKPTETGAPTVSPEPSNPAGDDTDNTPQTDDKTDMSIALALAVAAMVTLFVSDKKKKEA